MAKEKTTQPINIYPNIEFCSPRTSLNNLNYGSNNISYNIDLTKAKINNGDLKKLNAANQCKKLILAKVVN